MNMIQSLCLVIRSFFFNHINILHQNIAGLFSKSDLLTVQLDNMNKQGNDIDILCLTEHFVATEQENLLYIPNYCLGAIFCREKNRGGACIMVKNGHYFKELPEIAIQSIPGVIEMCAIELITCSVIILCIYRLPKHNSQSYMAFFEKLDIVLKKICLKTDKKIIICGDFNIDILRRSKITSELENFLLSFDLTLSLRQPTRLSSNTCIDNFAHNIKKGCKVKVVDLVLSDHTSQILTVPVKKVYKLETWQVMKKDYSNENMKKFGKILENLSFTEVYSTNRANEAYDNFNETFSLFYNLCFPNIWLKIKTEKKCKWISRGIKKCSKKQRQLLWQFRLNPTKQAKIKFQKYTTLYKNIIKLTQKAQNDYFIKSSFNKSKATWHIVNKPDNNLPKAQIATIKSRDLILTKPQEIANTFNDYFIDDIENNISDIQYNYKLSYLTSQSMFMRPIIKDDINIAIKSLKNTYTVGSDGVSTHVLKYVSNYISPVLSYIMNLCITQGIYPEKLKNTIIKPVFKKDDRKCMKNYRPIAKLSVFSKIFEKIIYDALYTYLSKYNILCHEQKGFRKNMSTNMAIFELLHSVITSIDERNPICAIYTDMTKAFDYVNHNTLLYKLYTYGIRGNVLELIESYLINRLQQTEITRLCSINQRERTFLSRPRIIKYGVPQGSILGPLLFLIYINDLPKSTHQQMVLFADDSTAIIKCNEYNDYQNDINNALINIINWFNRNNLIINLNKTKIMHFYQRKVAPNIVVNCNNCTLEQANSTKFLGLYIDNHLDWKSHIEQLSKKLNRAAYALLKISRKVNEEALLIAYYGLVDSILRYGIIFWGNSTNQNIIFKAQKRCVRAMYYLKPDESCMPLFKKLSILSLPSLYIFEVCVFVKNNLSMFAEYSTSRNVPLRSQYKNLLGTFKCKTALARKSILGMAPRVYNKLPEETKSLDTTHFKRRLKLLLTKKCYYSIDEYLNDEFI